MGAAVHGALAAWWALPLERRTPAAAGALVTAKWMPLGFRDDAQSALWQGRAVVMVERYVAGLDPHDEPIGVERTVGMRTERLAFSGRIDRLDRRSGELVVVDYKTGRHVLTTDDTRGSMALALYALAAARTLRTACVKVELHHLPTGDAHALADEITTAAEFPPRPGPMCGWCDYAAHCPEGRAAAPPKLSWAGLAEELEPVSDLP
jgi:hypothetical protein